VSIPSTYLLGPFAQIYFRANMFAEKKFQNQNISREKLRKARSYKKIASKMLMELKRGFERTSR